MRKRLRLIIDSGARIKRYFLRGHGSWFALALSLVQFTLIIYNDLIIKLYFVPEELKSYSIFFLIFIAIYFPTATVFGYLDYKKGTFSAEQVLNAELSPVWRKLFSKIEQLEQDNQQLLAELKRLKTNEAE